jgi:hypothetical protein
VHYLLRLICFAVPLGVMFWPAQMSAQTVPNRMGIVVEDLSPGASRCGLTVSGVRGAVFSALRFNRIEPDDESQVFVYVAITTLNIRGGCASSYNLSIQQFDTMPKLDRSHYFGVFQFCHKGGIETSSGYEHGKSIGNSIRDLTSSCLAEIKTVPLPNAWRSFLHTPNASE